MHRRILVGDRLLAAFLVGCVLFNYPLLSVFDRRSALFGIPLVFVYIFAAWAFLIVLMAWAVERRASRKSVSR